MMGEDLLSPSSFLHGHHDGGIKMGQKKIYDRFDENWTLRLMDVNALDAFSEGRCGWSWQMSGLSRVVDVVKMSEFVVKTDEDPHTYLSYDGPLLVFSKIKGVISPV